MENNQYLKYKNEFRVNCILKTVASALALLAIVFLVFVPNFAVAEEGIKLAEFSFLDEIIVAVNSIKGGFTSVASVFSMYQIVAMVYLAVAVGVTIFNLVKSVMSITNLEGYALERYDEIKMRANNSKKRFGNRFTVTNLFITGIALEVLYIVCLRGFGGYGAESYFAYVNSVTWYSVFFIIFTVAYAVVAVLTSVKYKQDKTAILKEDYGLASSESSD